MPYSFQPYDQQVVSDDMQEIISYRPRWIIRKANFLFLIIIVFLLGLTWFIKYPDKVTASAKLVALNPPFLVKSKSDGKLIKLFIANDQQVKKGDILGYMESTAEYTEVVQLHNWINETIVATDSTFNHLLKAPLPSLTSIGELQSSYQQLQTEVVLTKQTLANGYFQQKKGALQKDLDYIASLKSNTQKQQELQEEDNALQQRELEAYEKLAADKVIAPLELDQYKSKLLAKKQSLKQTSSQITASEITSLGKRKELLDLQKQVFDQQQSFRSSLLRMKNELAEWIQKYVLIAPENGQVVFINSIHENELMTVGQEILYIQPSQTEYYSELLAGQQGFGKIMKGQKVIIKLESYPSNEYGYLTGKVEYISSIPNRRDSFRVKVTLIKGLQTNYNQELFFRNALVGTAEIVTSERSLFNRLIGKIIH